MSFSYNISPTIEKARIYQAVLSGERTDGRKLDEYREIKIETGYVKKAEGSAFVHLGDTKVIAGIKVEVGTPFPDTPEKGVFLIGAEFVPTASPTFEPGPPDENAIELGRVVDRAIRHAEMIDLEKLCIIPGEKVYTVFADIYVIDHDGNLFDASTLAVVAAALTAKLPKYEIVDDNTVRFLDEMVPLPIKNRVVTITWARINNKLVVDPNNEEEIVMDSRITIGIDEHDKVVAIQKGGSGYMSYEDVEYALDKSFKLARDLIKKLPSGG